MAYLVLIVLMSFPFVWADDGINKTVTTAVSLTAARVPFRLYGRSGKADALATLFADDCPDPDAEKRRHNKNLKKTEKFFGFMGDLTIGAGKFTAAAGYKEYGAFAEGIGFMLKGVGGIFGFAAECNEVESRELQLIKCLKEDFKNFKKEFAEFRDKMDVKFEELNTKIDKGFKEIKDSIRQMSAELTYVVNELEDAQAMKDYTKVITEISTLKVHYRTYTRYPSKGGQSELLTFCIKYDPLGVLKEIESVHIGVLKTKASQHYPLLMNRCKNMTLELIEVAIYAIGCFAISETGKTEEARLDRENEIVNIVQNIMMQMQDAMQKAKQDLINNIIPAKFPRDDSCHEANLAHRRDRRATTDDDAQIQLCQLNAMEVYNYLRDVHSWAEWTVVATYGRSTGTIEYDPPNAILGEAKNINLVRDCCSYSVIWCEHNDDIRKENAQRFKKWKDPSFLCLGDNLPAFVESLQNKLSSSPALPNSPTIWNGIMAILTVEADEEYQNSNAIDFGNDHSKFGDDNLIKGHCKMTYGRHYNIYYHVCF